MGRHRPLTQTKTKGSMNVATPEMPRGDLVRWMREIESRIAVAEKRDPFINSGVSVTAPGVHQVDGSLIVQNGEAKSGNYAAGSTGWHLGNDGSAEFNSLVLRSGIINNAALSNAVSFDGNGGAATNFAVTTTGSTSVLISVTNTVPAGMTKMASFVSGNVTAVNSTASLDYLQSRVGITGPTGTNYAGNSGFAPVAASGGSQQVSASKYGILSGLSGGQTVTHYMNVWASTASWAANTSNVADLQAIILWGS